MSELELTTARLALRPFDPADAAELIDLFRNPSVRRFLLDDMEVAPEWVSSEIAASERRFRRSGTGLWALRRLNEKRIIGFAGFREFFDPSELQLLYGLLPEAWGQGLATEAAVAVCDYGFKQLGMDAIRAATDTPNHASVRVLERLGMERIKETSDGEAGTVFFAVSRRAWSLPADQPEG